MNEQRIRRIYGIVLSVALTAAAICLMVACVGIYRSGGEQIYTPRKVAEAFQGICIVVYLAVALVLGGAILHICLPNEKLKLKLGKNEPLILKKLHEKQDYTLCGDARIRQAIEKEQKLRRLLRLGNGALLILGCLAFFAYALEFDRYNLEDITGVVVRGVWVLLPCMALPFGFGIFRTLLSRESIRREIGLMKLVAAPRQTNVTPKTTQKDRTRVIRVVILAVAVVLIVGGYMMNGWSDVLTKAINICTECVGLG